MPTPLTLRGIGLAIKAPNLITLIPNPRALNLTTSVPYLEDLQGPDEPEADGRRTGRGHELPELGLEHWRRHKGWMKRRVNGS